MRGNTDSKRLGALVRRHRVSARRSLREVARDAGIDSATMIHLEQGRYSSPSPLTLKGVATALGIPTLELFAAAGYVTPDDLIAMARYVQYRDDPLPGEVAQQLNDLIARSIAERGLEGPEITAA